MSIHLSANCQTDLKTDSTSVNYPVQRIDEHNDTTVVFSLEQSRQIENWLDELDFLKVKVVNQKKALDSASSIMSLNKERWIISERRLDAEKINSASWKIKAKKRNRDKWIIIGTSSVLTVVLTSFLISK